MQSWGTASSIDTSRIEFRHFDQQSPPPRVETKRGVQPNLGLWSNQDGVRERARIRISAANVPTWWVKTYTNYTKFGWDKHPASYFDVHQHTRLSIRIPYWFVCQKWSDVTNMGWANGGFNMLINQRFQGWGVGGVLHGWYIDPQKSKNKMCDFFDFRGAAKPQRPFFFTEFTFLGLVWGDQLTASLMYIFRLMGVEPQ